MNYQMSVEIPLVGRIANILPDDLVLQHFIQMLNATLRVFNELLRHQLDRRLGNENVYHTYFDRRGRTRKKINVVIKEPKFGIPPRPLFNLLTIEIAYSGWMNDVFENS